MSLILQSSGGGQITINEPTTASNFTQTLPASNGTVVVSGTTPTLNGITFPATQVPSADANTLDDYEEGTWTPVDASGAGLTFTVSGTARYVKIGRLVFFSVDFINYPSTANASGASIGGLPFTSDSNNSGTLSFVASTGNASAGLTVSNSTRIFLYPNGTTSQSTNAGLSGATIYGISGCYQV